MDIATLGLRVENGQIVQATDALQKLSTQAGMTEGTVRRWERATTDASIAANRHRQEIVAEAEAYKQSRTEVEKATPAVIGQGVAIEKVGKGAAEAHVSMGRFNNAVANLGLSAVGIQGPMQKIVETIAMLGFGGPVVIGVLATLAALTAAFMKVTEQTRHAQKAYNDYMDSLRKASSLALVGAELDRLQEKLKHLQSPGSLGFLLEKIMDPTATIPKTITAIKELQTQYQSLFQTVTDHADEAAKAMDKLWQKESDLLDATSRWLEINNRAFSDLQSALQDIAVGVPNRNVIMGPIPGFFNMGTGPDAALAAANNAHAMAGTEEHTKKIAENWAQAAQSVTNVVTLLSNADDATSRFLASIVTGGGQLESALAEIKQTGGLSATGTIGLIGAGFGLISSFFGANPDAERSQQIQRDNTEAIRRLTSVMEAGITGTGYAQAKQSSAFLLGNPNPIAAFTNYPAGSLLDPGKIDALLRSQGTSLAALQAFAKSVGITLDMAGLSQFLDSLRDLQTRLNQLALVTLTTFAGKLDILNRQWALAGTGPIDKLRDLLRTIQGQAPGLAGLGGFDVGTGSGRQAAKQFLQDQLALLQSGSFPTESLGGLTVQQYLDFISQFGQLLDEANGALKDTVKNLQAFADSLKLDSALSTLSPVQKLAEAKRQYEATYAAAIAGDAAAQAQLPGAGRAFLEASRAYNASSPAYAADFNRVTQDLDVLTRYLNGVLSGGGTIPGSPGGGDITPIVGPITNMDTNIGQMIVEQQATVSLLKEGLQQAVDRLDELVVGMAENTRVTRLAIEGQAL